MPPTGLILELGEKSPKGKDDKSSPMGGDDAPLDEFDTALDDAFEAVKANDKEGFKAALGAAVSAKCAEMYAGEDEET